MFRSINRYSICVVRFLEETICVDELTKSDELIEFGEFPDFWEAEKDIPHLSKAMFHQCHFAVNPQKHLFASCSYFVLEIYEYDPSGKNVRH